MCIYVFKIKIFIGVRVPASFPHAATHPARARSEGHCTPHGTTTPTVRGEGHKRGARAERHGGFWEL